MTVETSAEAGEPRALRAGWPDEVVGVDQNVPLFDGTLRRFVNLDNAASTPPLVAVQQAVLDFLPWYSSVHRGAGYKSRVATAAYEEAREVVASFLNVDRSRQEVIFVKSTTEGLNRVARGLAARGTTIFMSIMEHHANMLPWRLQGSCVQYVQADGAGVIDEEDLERRLRLAAPGPKLVAVGGAYNVTGYSPPIHRLAALAHRYGAEILVDGAQLAPHRVVDLQGAAPDEQIDYLVFSGHKIYAPFGAGVLIAPRAFFQGAPDVVGGGAVDLVTTGDVVWTELPDREEAGSPNVVGAVALASALRRLEQIGRRAVEDYEAALTEYAVSRLLEIPGLVLLGPRHDRVGIFSFVLPQVPHGLVAAALSYEYAIGVRNGCFCAHPGMLHLLGTAPGDVEKIQQRILAHDKSDVPGAVRASLGLYNTVADVDALVGALHSIAAGDLRTSYTQSHGDGSYAPRGGEPDYGAALPWALPLSA